MTNTGDFILNIAIQDARDRLGDNAPPLPTADPDDYLDLLCLAIEVNDPVMAGDTEPPAMSYEVGSEMANAAALRAWNRDRQTRWQDYRNSSGYNQGRESKNAAAALAGAVTDLAKCSDGQRNSLLNAKAWRLGRFVNAGLLDRGAVESALLDACRVNTLLRDDGERQCRATMASGLDSAARAKIMPLPLRERSRLGSPSDSGTVTDSSDSDGGDDDTDVHAHAVQVRAAQMRIEREARAIVDSEQLPPVVYPTVTPLAQLLAEPDEAVRYRIDKVAPTQGNIILSAQFKAGKTTLVNNLIRSLADGDPFLGTFDVKQPARRLVLVDNEMGRNTLRRWLREQNITNVEAVADVITLRGRVSMFNILDDKIRGRWVRRLTDLGCDYLMFDCLRPVLDALGLDENRDVGKFLVPFDALLADAAIPDSFIVQHMGHSGERSRGDSRLLDWPDATWRVVRETESPDSPRFFAAYGRDVDVYEGRLNFDPVTRRLSYAAGSRGDSKTEAASRAVIELLAQSDDPLSSRSIESGLMGEHPQKSIRNGIGQAVKGGFVIVTDGPKRSKLHAIAYPCSECGMPVAGRRARHESCATETRELFT